MTSKTLEIEGTWEEILAQADNFVGHRLKITILDEEDSKESILADLKEALLDGKNGKTFPLEELWTEIDT